MCGRHTLVRCQQVVFRTAEQVADRLLTLAQTESRIGCEVATSAMLLAVLVQGGQRPPTPDDKDRCHFVAD